MLRINYDALGISASLACAIHCAILPLVFSSLPIFGLEIIDNIYFELGMILLALVVGILALVHGYKRHHHRWLPVLLFSSGIAFLLAKEVFHEIHLWLLAPALTLIVFSHYLNYRYCREAKMCHSTDCKHA